LLKSLYSFRIKRGESVLLDLSGNLRGAAARSAAGSVRGRRRFFSPASIIENRRLGPGSRRWSGGVRAVLAAALVCCAGGERLSGQVASGTVTVQVEDSSGALIPGAQVTVENVHTGLTRAGAANERGEFLAPFLPAGAYTVSAGQAGFKRTTISGLELRVDQSASIRVVLQPGEVRESVLVTELTPLLESTTSSLGQVIENRKILELPLNGRNPFALGLLAGNTTPLFGMGSNLPFIGGGGRFSQNEVTLDGLDNNTTMNSGAIGRSGIAFAPSVDAVQEFKVKTSTFSAEFGHSAGTVVNATIKSGTNEFHGAAFEFLRNDKLDANNFFTSAAGLNRAAFRQKRSKECAGWSPRRCWRTPPSS
jgi:hypothetical protein